MTSDNLTENQVSLLLYLETRAVDYGGKVDTQHMNADDLTQAKAWTESGFIGFGRICWKDVEQSRYGTHWVELTDAAWMVVGQERRARAERRLAERSWMRTEEKQAS